MNEEDDLEAKEDGAGEAHEESKLGKLFDKAKGKAAEGLEAAKSGVRKGASAGKALAKKGAKATKGFVESGAVKAKVEKTKAVTKKLAKATGEGTKLAAGKVKEASAKAFEKTAEGASAAAKATKHFAGKVAEKTVEGGTTAFEKVKETAESVGEFTKEKLEGAKEALGGRKAGFAEPQSSEPQSSGSGARNSVAGEPEFLGRLGEARQSAKAQREAPEPKEGKARTEAQTAWEPNQKAGGAGTAKNGRTEAREAEAEPKEAGKAETMAEELEQTAGAYAAKTKGKKFLLAVACAGALAGGGLTYSVVGPRYTIAEEFALTYDCIFNQKQKISAGNYEKLAECCAEVVEKLEEKFPSLESIADRKAEVASQIQESCRNE